MTREESLAVVTMLVEAYPQREVSSETMRAYAMHLADLPKAPTLAAVKRLIGTSKWLPSIAEIREAVAVATLPAVPDVALAWSEALALLGRIGVYGSLGNAGSPYVNRTLRLCGRWADICQEDTTWLRKRFAEIYAGVVSEVRTARQIGAASPGWLEEQKPAAIEAQVQALLDDLSVKVTA